MLKIMFILFLLLSSISTFAESFTEIYLKKIEDKKNAEKEITIPTTPVISPVAPPPIEVKIIKPYSLGISSRIEYFKIKTTDLNSNTSANFVSNISHLHEIEFSKEINSFNFGAIAEIHSYSMLAPTNATTLKDSVNTELNWGAFTNFNIGSNKFGSTIGNEKIFFIKAVNASELKMVGIESYYCKLDYKYQYELDHQLTFSPGVFYTYILKSEKDSISTISGKKIGIEFELSKELKKFEFVTFGEFNKRIQKSNFSSDEETNFSLGIGFNIAF